MILISVYAIRCLEMWRKRIIVSEVITHSIISKNIERCAKSMKRNSKLKLKIL